MRYFILTSDKYSFLLEGNIKLWKKYWADDIKIEILGFDTPDIELPDNFIFHSLGKQSDHPTWSGPLIEFFSSLEDDKFFLSFEDHFLVKPVNIGIINEGIGLMESDSVIDKLHIHSGYGGMIVGGEYKNTWYEISNKPSSVCWASLLPSIWRTSFFLELLKNNVKTPWDFETKHHKLSNKKVLISKGVDIFITLDAMRSGKFNTVIFDRYKNNKAGGPQSYFQNLDVEDIDIFHDMNKIWKNR